LDTDYQVRSVLDEVLSLNGRSRLLGLNARLLDALPELDSMAATSIVTLLEERLGFVVEPGELDGAIFESLAALIAFVETKRRESA
jgi:acyl carrier protein